tara:strand:- start:2480 stop:3352 length:873 start_codon:yes stop_codon:yes gene_type:complete
MSDLLNNIKSLRERTGAGFLDCKVALEQNNNEIQKSIDYLRKKGLAKASKKSGRTANEGAVGVFVNSDKTLLIEINTETDFAAKNEVFLNFVEKISKYLHEAQSENNINLDQFMEMSFENKKISDYFTEIISQIGENIVLKKFKFLKQNSNSKVFTYTHNAYKKNIGKMCVALNAEVDNISDEVLSFGKNLCMHIAAMKPISLDLNSLDDEIINKEKQIQLETIQSSGKPKEIIEKILDGKMKKFYSEVLFLNQKYILDEERSVEKVITDFNTKNEKFKIINYTMFILGS